MALLSTEALMQELPTESVTSESVVRLVQFVTRAAAPSVGALLACVRFNAKQLDAHDLVVTPVLMVTK